MDELAATLAFEFNKVYSQGQGLVGFKQLTSAETVSDPDAALDAAGLAFTPVSGAFDVLINSKDGTTTTTTTHTILIDLDGLDDDTTLNSLAAQLDAIDGLSASVSSMERWSWRPSRMMSSLRSRRPSAAPPMTRMACWRPWD